MAFQPRYNTLLELYNDAIQNYPYRELFGVKTAGRWEWTTYGEFARKVDRMRAGLSHLGVAKGEHVAIISNNRPEWAVTAYAALGLGALYVPMYEAQLDKDWEFILRDCGATVLVVASGAIYDKTKQYLSTIPSLRHIVVMEGAPQSTNGLTGRVHSLKGLLERVDEVPCIDVTPDDLACLIYTSGTTGNPKGVMLTHGNVARNVSAARYVFPMDRQDRSLSFLPWAHVFGQVVELHAMISAGASMGLAESVDKIVDNLAEVQPTLLFSVPRIFNKIYTGVQKQIASKPKVIQEAVKLALKATAKERRGIRLGIAEHAALQLTDRVVFAKVRAKFGGRLKYAFSGGAALSRDVAEFIDSLGITIYEGYGLSETSPIATANCPGERRIGSVGRAIPGVRIEIDPHALAEKKVIKDVLKDRIEGEIVIYGHNVMKGYLNRPEENDKVFTSDGGFRSGDMGYVDPHGYLYITGRIKEQYKLENGKYVVPTPIEEQLKLSPYILNCMVYGDNRLFNTALVVVNTQAVRDWANGQQPPLQMDLTEQGILTDSRVRQLIKGEIARFTTDLKGYEEIRDFALIGEDFSQDNGMLTPSLKVKRRKVMEVYGHLLDALYQSGARRDDRRGASASAPS
jgi:long-chain acyl-CoA synthetase